MNIQLSPTKLILCDFEKTAATTLKANYTEYQRLQDNIDTLSNTACYGNTLVQACIYLFETGTPTLECVPYFLSKKNIDTIPLCNEITGTVGDMCSVGYNFDITNGEESGIPSKFYKAANLYHIPGTPESGGKEENIRKEIYKWGPVATGMATYADFYTFKAGVNDIYKWNGKGERVGGHAIELVGWGTTSNNIDYWIVKNSWGKMWGDNGYFKMIRGENNCGIEENCMAMLPDFFTSLKVSFSSIGDTTIEQRNEKTTIASNKNILGGGIDPETGYSRRVMIRYPYLNLSRPVELSNIPYLSGQDFTAALIPTSTSKQSNMNLDTKNKKYNNTPLLIYGIVGLIAIIVLIIIILRRRTH